MYRIVGADGQQYGPADAAQIRRWFAENRVRRDSLVQLDGTAEWKPLSAFPEFADLINAAPGTPPPLFPAVTPPSAPDPDLLVAEVLARNPSVQIGSCISRGWNLVTANFWLCVGVTFVGSVVANVPFLLGPAYAGLFWFFLKQIRGRNAKFEDAFEPFNVALLQTFLAGLVWSILVSLGMMLCVIPGLVFGALWAFTWPLLMDKRLEFWPAMEVSRRVLWPNFGGIFCLWCICFLLLLGGMLACYVGIFVAMPVIIAAQAYAYEDFFGNSGASRSAETVVMPRS